MAIRRASDLVQFVQNILLKGGLGMRADDFGWLVGGFFTIVLPWYFKNKKQNEETKRKMKEYELLWQEKNKHNHK